MSQKHLIVASIFASVCILGFCDCYCTHNEDDDSGWTDEKWTNNDAIDLLERTSVRAHSGENLTIDAFKYSMCGKSNLRDWQLREEGFGCKARRSSSGPRSRTHFQQQRIADGELAKDGEFPSFAHLWIKDATSDVNVLRNCGGTLVHSNLLITTAQCIVNASSIRVVIGCDRFDGTGDGCEEVQANSWCHDTRYVNDANGSRWDLGVVRLSRTVEYEANKVWPACLLLRYSHHSDRACAMAGMGRHAGTLYPIRLKTLVVRRTCTEPKSKPIRSCYQADTNGSACSGDTGSGVFCYDDCYAGDQRAFLVGVISGVAPQCTPGERNTQHVTDLNGMADSARGMIDILIGGNKHVGHNIDCHFV